MTAPGAIDLMKSSSCMLSLIDASVPAGPIEPAELDRWITHVVLPAPTAVWVDDHLLEMGVGEHKYVRSESMTYTLAQPDQ